MNENNIPHTQLPNQMDDLTPEDKLIYLSIKRFQNHKTGKCFASLATIAKVSNTSINYVKKIINKLSDLQYITVTKIGRQNYYTFNKYTNFECFTDAFLDFENISFTTKAFLAASQQHMYIDCDNNGKITYSNMELSDLINMPIRTIQHCQKELKDLGFLSVVPTQATGIGGCKNKLFMYHLYAFGQLVYQIKHMNDRLDDHEEKLDVNTEEIAQLKADIAELQKTQQILLQALKEQEKIKQNQEIIL